MKRLEVKNLHIIEGLKREIRKTKDGWYSLKLRCVLFIVARSDIWEYRNIDTKRAKNI